MKKKLPKKPSVLSAPTVKKAKLPLKAEAKAKEVKTKVPFKQALFSYIKKVLNGASVRDADFVPFSFGMLFGGFVFLFVGMVLGKYTVDTSCQALDKIEAAEVFCENLIEKTAGESCANVEEKDVDSCLNFVRSQAWPSCLDMVEMQTLQDEAQGCK